MACNKFKPHLIILPEDDANRDIANGFIQHPGLNARNIQIMPVLGGWTKVKEEYRSVYVNKMKPYPDMHLLLLIDFDGDGNRSGEFIYGISEDIRSRTFILGSFKEPFDLKLELNSSFEQIGFQLADECANNQISKWHTQQLSHNRNDLDRLFQTVRPFLFP